MKTIYFTFTLFLVFGFSYGQETEKQLDNYTIKRLLICNEKDELIVVKYGDTWNVPALRYNQSESINQSLNNLAKDMGIEITKPEIGGIFSFTYSFNEQAALRMFYVANYKTGNLKPKSGWDSIKWISKEDFLKMKGQDLYSLMASKIEEDSSTLWGAAFFLFKEDEEIKYTITEEFYSIR
ncbi:hypothetical protein [Winogradskyella luteola]|uniref:Uncharacterized protein n=1 Tax=Winogradskyella luteola TaxID=2828330 RepID=A0A9X1FC93_9FLAO|nr:hypothetical protein [Winogradskyella luteola]MBV7270318.1 hypothetical protein [Winogradskyella luteola]